MAPKPTCLCGECEKCKRREYMREWYRRGNNAANQCESQRKGRLGRVEKVRAYDRARGRRYSTPEKEAARKAVNYAVIAGRLHRGPCEMADDGRCKGRIEGHHDDYSKPLEVRWLCQLHHGIVHRRVAA